jgi:hypothetical protein
MSVMEVKEAGAKHLTEQEHSVIYVYADNCNPCNLYAPKFLNVSEKLSTIKFGKFKLPKDEPSEFKRTWLKVETGKPPYGTPTTLVFKNGECIGIHQGAILDEERLEYFVLNGKMPARQINQAIADLPDNIKELALKKDLLSDELKNKQLKINEITRIVDAGQSTEQDRIERALYDEECNLILLDINRISQNIREELAKLNSQQQ